MTGRRLRRVRVNAKMYVDVMKDGWATGVHVIANALPVDAGVVACSFEMTTLWVWIIVESESFDPVPDGEVIPIHPDPVFENREPVNWQNDRR